MDVLDDYIDLYKEDGDARIFTLLFNTSNLISPAYAAAIVLGISFGIAALAGLLYYALIGGFDSDGGYGGYSQYSSYLNKLGFRRRRSTLEDDLDLVSILKSLDSTEHKLSRHENDIDDNYQLSPSSLCKIKLKLCRISHDAKSSSVHRKNEIKNKNMMKLNHFFMDLRKFKQSISNQYFTTRVIAKLGEKPKHKFLDDILRVEEEVINSENCGDFMRRQQCSNF